MVSFMHILSQLKKNKTVVKAPSPATDITLKGPHPAVCTLILFFIHRKDAICNRK